MPNHVLSLKKASSSSNRDQWKIMLQVRQRPKTSSGKRYDDPHTNAEPWHWSKQGQTPWGVHVHALNWPPSAAEWYWGKSWSCSRICHITSQTIFQQEITKTWGIRICMQQLFSISCSRVPGQIWSWWILGTGFGVSWSNIFHQATRAFSPNSTEASPGKAVVHSEKDISHRSVS